MVVGELLIVVTVVFFPAEISFSVSTTLSSKERDLCCYHCTNNGNITEWLVSTDKLTTMVM